MYGDVRIVILGGGSAAQRHFRALKNLFSESNIYIISKYSRPFHSNWHSDFTGLKNKKFEIGVIATPAPFHLESVKILVDVCSIVLIEKPLASNLEDALRILRISEGSDTFFGVGYQLRYSGALIAMREHLHTKTLKIYKVDAAVGQNLLTWRSGQNHLKGVSANKILGGGVLLELSHELDYLNWIFGPLLVEYSNVEKNSNLVNDVEDLATISLRAKNTTGSFPIQLSLDMVSWYHHRFCHVATAEESILWDGKEDSLSVVRDDKTEIVDKSNCDKTNRMWQDLASILNSQAKEFESVKVASIQEGVEVIRLVEQARLNSNNV